MSAAKIRGGVSQAEADVVLRAGGSEQATLRHPSGVGSTSVHELPAESGTKRLVARDSTDTLTNKTFDVDGTGNSLSNVADANIKAGAAIDATKLADGSVSNTEFQTLGTAGTDASGELVTTDATQTLTGKTLDGDDNTFVDFSQASSVGTDRKLAVDTSAATDSTTTTLTASQTASRVVTLPDATTTLVGRDTTDTLSNKTLTDPVINDNGSIDTAGAAQLNIGGTNATTVNIGRSGQTTVVKGDLQVDGTTTTVNSTTLDVADANITVNDGGNQASADGTAGVTVEMSDATDVTLLYDSTLASRWKAGDAGSEVELVNVSSTQTLTGKTLTGNTAATLSPDGVETLTLPVATDTLVGRATTDTLTNKTLTGNTAASLSPDGVETLTFPVATDTLVGRATTDTLTNKTLTAPAINGGDVNLGTASTSNKLVVSKESFANLDALAREEASLYYDQTNGRMVFDDGTSLRAIGESEGVGVNLNPNPNATTDVDLGATDDLGDYVSSGAGATVAKTSTAADLPLYPVRATGVKLSLAAGSGDYVRLRMTVPDAAKNRKLGLQWYQLPSGYTSGDFRLQAYKNSAADFSGSYTQVPLASDDASGNTDLTSATGLFRTALDWDDADALELRWVNNSATTGNLTLNDVRVTPDPSVAQAIVVTPWESFTPTGDLTTNVTYTGFKRRVGTELECRIRMDFAGDNTEGAVRIDVPDSLTVDTSAIESSTAQQLGPVTVVDASPNASFVGATTVHSTSQVRVRYFTDSSTEEVLADVDTGPIATYAAGDFILAAFRVPIAEWAGSGTVNVGQNDVEYASHDGTNVVFGQAGAAIPTTTPAGTNEEYVITSAFPSIQASDQFRLEIQRAGTGPWIPTSNPVVPDLYFDGTNWFGAGLYYDGTDLRMRRGKYRYEATNAWSGLPSGTRWRVVKYKAGTPVGFGNATATQLGLVKQTQVLFKEDSSAYATNGTDVLEITNLPSGRYRVTMGARNFNQGGTADNGCYLIAQLNTGGGYSAVTIGGAEWRVGLINSGDTDEPSTPGMSGTVMFTASGGTNSFKLTTQLGDTVNGEINRPYYILERLNGHEEITSEWD